MKIVPAHKIVIVENESNVSNIDNYEVGLNIAEWNSTTDYSILDTEVIVLNYNGVAVNSVFKSNGVQLNDDGTTSQNINFHPTKSSLWRVDRKTNLYKCITIQEFGETKADVGQTNLVLVFTFNEASDIFLRKVNGASVRIEQFDSSGAIIGDTGVIGMIEKPRNSRELLLFKKDQTPSFNSSLVFAREQKIRVTIEGGDASLGLILVGTAIDVGCAKYGITRNDTIIGDSKIDEWGRYPLVEKDFVSEVKLNVHVKEEDLESIGEEMNELLNVPAFYIVNNNPEGYMSTIGTYKDKASTYVSRGVADIGFNIRSFLYENKKNKNWQ